MRDIESRLAALERANRHYRAGLAVSLAALGVVVLAGFQEVRPYPTDIVANSISVRTLQAATGQVTNLTSSGARFGSISATEAQLDRAESRAFTATNFQARVAALAQASAQLLEVMAPNGRPAMSLSAGEGLVVINPQGLPTASLSSSSNAGDLKLFGPGGKQVVSAGFVNGAGTVRTFHPEGRLLTSLGLNNVGQAQVAAHTANGGLGAFLSTGDQGRVGRIVVQQGDGFEVAVIEQKGKSGQIRTFGPEGKIEATFPPETP
ncbi:MAG: hypothetical protein KF884_00100 [Fimbriimonadaceae bacterium]|nr:hypothetical protein [Fimbriimonadaceae bacterium]QYK58496.1 MAG: hypothetical protein KF884_00100 [Fimbriimonadaceae bacterium]